MRLLLLIAALCVGLSLALVAGKKLPKLSPAERERYFIICIAANSPHAHTGSAELSRRRRTPLGGAARGISVR